jgi:single stranded DNA-binding protein
MIYLSINGRLGSDAEIKTSKNDNQFVSMRVASNDFANGEKTTTWISVVWSGERALKMAQYMKKGSSVLIHGTGRFSTYQDKNGSAQVAIDVMADRVDFDSNTSNSGDSQTNETVTDTGTLKPKSAKKSSEPQPAMATVAAQTANDTDDLPF